MEKEKTKTVTSLIEEVATEFCEHYCKWPENYKAEEHEGVELFDSEICDKCPLNKLI